METYMSYILLALVHLLVVAAIAGMIFFLWHMVNATSDVIEKFLRAAAFAAGLLIYVGAKAVGISIPELMSNALHVTRPFTLGIFGVLIPGAAGTLVAWFCLRLMQKDDNVAARGLVLFAALIFTMFADSYAMMASEATATTIRLILPNITFVVGVVLYTIFEYKPGAVSGGHQTKSWSEPIRNLGRGMQKFRAERRGVREGLGGKEASAEQPAGAKAPREGS